MDVDDVHRESPDNYNDMSVKIAESRLSFFSFLFYFPFVLFLAYRARIRDSMVYVTKEDSRRMISYHIGTSWLTHSCLE